MKHRRIILTTFALLICATLALTAQAAAPVANSTSFNDIPDRVWIGPEFWANRLHDWRVADERLECVTLSPNIDLRTVSLLTCEVGPATAGFEMSARTGAIAEGEISPYSASGALLGIGGGKMEDAAAALVQMRPGTGGGLFVGIDGTGRVFIRDNEKNNRPVLAQSDETLESVDDVRLTISSAIGRSAVYSLTVTAAPSDGGESVSVTTQVLQDRLIGNLAIACLPGAQIDTTYWYDDLSIAGDALLPIEDAQVGPIICTQYTLSEGVMKMTAQLMPVADSELVPVELQVQQGGAWATIATADIITPGWTATFRVPEWNDGIDTPYRVVFQDAEWAGTVRKDPVDKETIVVAGFTGNHNNAHGFGNAGYNYAERIYFPHTAIVDATAYHEPDLLFFSGDQVYEGDSPTFPDRSHGTLNLQLDYLYKWYLWCWAYRDLTKDIPVVTIPDDHDVYQGNLWGDGGRATEKDDKGGYVQPAEFVQMVERTQTLHLPDPYDPSELEQGITSYYCPLNVGRVGFAVLEDRKFKSGCNRPDMPLELTTGRADHYNDASTNPDVLDIEGLTLLGPKQLEFLNGFAADWTDQDMKCALSQTIFASMATHHGGGLMRLMCDLDSNGWPQSGRNRAVSALRSGHIFHLGGDQHLATVVRHGIDVHGDAMWSFCVPSICNFYPRAWAPEQGLGQKYVFPEPEDYLGERLDGFHHPVTVHAVTNPGREGGMGQEPAELHDKMPGYGIVRFHKPDQTITMECWPRSSDPATDEPYEGWPITIEQSDNYGRAATGYLPEISIDGVENAVVQVIDESDGSLVYALRLQGNTFTPHTFAGGTYTVRIGDPDTGVWKTAEGQTPVKH